MTAEVVAVRSKRALPLVSRMEVPIFGLVSVLFVSVWVPVRVTTDESMAKVMAPAEPVVVIPAPAVKVKVPPWLTVWVVVPEEAPAVQRLPPDTRQVEQPMSPRAERVTGLVAETATVPVALGKVMTLLEDAGVQVKVPVVPEPKVTWFEVLVNVALVA